MQYRTLGKDGPEVSVIGFGCWQIGGGWGTRDDDEAIRAIQLAHDLGVNFYDTAYVYGDGHSERLIGKAFKGKRDQIVIASKIPQAEGWGEGPAEAAFPAQHIVDCTERTLKNLGADHLDVQQFHAWNPDWLKAGDWLEAVERLKAQGKIRRWGVSVNDWEPYNGESLMQSGLANNLQVIYNLFEQRPAERLLPAARDNGVGVIVRVPFEEGLLTGKFKPDHEFEEGDWRGEWLTPERLAEAEPHLDAVREDLEEGEDLATLALRFVLAHSAVTSVIPGMRREAHVRANCAVGDMEPLSLERTLHLQRHKWYHGWPYPWHA